MPRRPLLLLTVALTLAPAARAQRDDPDKAVARVLEVQNALAAGRQLLARGDAKKAVEVLEAQLPFINGNRDYLGTLRDAYWAHLKDLQRAQNSAEIARVLPRLRLLDPAAKLDGYDAEPPKTPAPLAVPGTRPEVKARGQADDSDPFQQSPLMAAPAAGDVLPQAEALFKQNRYADAEKLYERADPRTLGAARGNWAYCILRRCVDRLNQPAAGDADAVESDIRRAIALAEGQPKLQTFGQTLLDRTRDWRAAAPAPSAGGWSAVESANFRVLHRQSADLAERVAKHAEQARSNAFQKWWGGDSNAWAGRCDVYLHPTAEQYVLATKGLPQAHGHSTVEVKDGKVAARRIDLVAAHPGLLTAAVPREVTHAVLADVFHDPLLPRWADEAMAVLAEPRAIVEQYLRALPRCRREGRLVALDALVKSTDFPDAAGITAFYVESVSLVDTLVAERGPKAFTTFLLDARRYGYEKALERNYRIRSFAELQDRWERRSFVAGAE